MTGPRQTFHKNLDDLQNDVTLLGSMVEKAIRRAMDALVRQDESAAQQIIRDDGEINRRRFEIEERALELVALQAPMASDLRVIAAVFNVSSDLERMGDHAAGIAEIVLMHKGEPRLQPLTELENMAEQATSMLRQALDSFANRDPELARRVCSLDDGVDELYDSFYHSMLQRMIDDPSLIQRATYLIWVSHNLERIADRATNICERVVFLITGRMEELNVSSY
ncbi:MAG: phosphate signaling complex protein PhoU [Dehalococcoidia bacterium]